MTDGMESLKDGAVYLVTGVAVIYRYRFFLLVGGLFVFIIVQWQKVGPAIIDLLTVFGAVLLAAAAAALVATAIGYATLRWFPGLAKQDWFEDMEHVEGGDHD